MTAGVYAAAARPAVPRRAIPLRPAEGWLTLFATMAMVMILGGSLQAAAWTPDWTNPDSHFLPWVGLAGVVWGVFGAKVGWGRWRTHILGALIGGLILPLIAGGIALGQQAHVGWDPLGLARRLVEMLRVVQGVWADLVVYGKPRTSEYAHYHLVFGVLVWGAGILAGFTVFGHRRPLDAVVVVGLVLIANMALTTQDQLLLIVLFSGAALLLLIRTHVFDEELTWARRKIGDPGTVGQLYLRGGAGFVAAAIIGSVVLTNAASSAPLQNVWTSVPQYLQGLQKLLLQIGPPGGTPRTPGLVGFGQTSAIGDLWQPNDIVAFRAELQPQETRSVKWRAGSYAEYTRFGWSWGQPENTDPIDAGAAQPLPLGEPSVTVGRRDFYARIIPVGFQERTVIAPNELLSVDRTSNAISVGGGDYFTSVESDDSLNAYDIDAKVPLLADIQGGVTASRLRQAGTNYPPELFNIYTQLPKDSMGPASDKLLATIKSTMPEPPPGVDRNNPYDLARAIETYLADSAHFTYDTDVRDDQRAYCSGDVSTVECFALMRRGFCQYYATTMAVLLRASHVPARIAYGFLPGTRGSDNVETVSVASEHWWVEVYFPYAGWVEFDPTGKVGQPQKIPEGSLAPETAKPSAVAPTFRGEQSQSTAGSVGGRGSSGAGAGPFIAIAVILVIGVLALVYAAMRRAPNKPMHPDTAWGSLARLAARLGIGPRPSQTVYEYAGVLGDEVPAVRVEVTTLARAKVEVAYGRRDLGDDRLRRIAQAYQRLRLALIGLIVRRGLRRRR